eukprot:NODE_344_length_1843_cov_65.906912_g250_i0.p1 GENE.NODE_344_length_1843_cov_65.906912_g250_i0~~NODE_344_length_1843_cov_65.906912_g250_i0.p1  ORF type:complete len:484 (-),score=130.25 NODE_344_length_1843_cov_65.906912_g250_i0:336-1787(-)
MPCCGANRGSGAVVLMTACKGTPMAPLTQEMQRAVGTVYPLTMNSTYLPGSSTPASLLYPKISDRMDKMVEDAYRAVEKNAATSFVELADPFQVHVHTAKSQQKSVKTVAALAYHPIHQLGTESMSSEDAATALLQFGVAFKGTPVETERTVDQLSVDQLEDVLDELDMEPRDVKRVADSLVSMLGLEEDDHVFLEPRFSYDVVVNTTNPVTAAKQLVDHVQSMKTNDTLLSDSAPPSTAQIEGSNLMVKLHYTGRAVGRISHHVKNKTQEIVTDDSWADIDAPADAQAAFLDGHGAFDELDPSPRVKVAMLKKGSVMTRGLVALRNIEKGEVVDFYIGNHLTNQQLAAKKERLMKAGKTNAQADWALTKYRIDGSCDPPEMTPANRVLDPTDQFGVMPLVRPTLGYPYAPGMGPLVNEPGPEQGPPNVEIGCFGGQMCLVATRKINKGAEATMCYTKDYARNYKVSCKYTKSGDLIVPKIAP